MKTYNPDVLLCLANLSNDEVFTPPQLANEVLDLLPEEIWKDKNVKFLDPCCKTGVFLREITIRLIEGLKDEIPDLQERVNHILTNQVFGIGVTELTALTSRRTLYCSKDAHGEFSICTAFEHPEGNIYYRRVEHDWKSGKCACCGANQKEFDRSAELETYAYAFIHKPIEELFNMKFDVIIGNPPYHLKNSGHGASATSLYPKFVEIAKKLNPRFVSMIIPARWYSGSKLAKFRNDMISDKKLSTLVDFPNSLDCFPNNDIEGGICYFLWERDYEGDCEVITKSNNAVKSKSMRPLKYEGIEDLIRYNEVLSILKKISDKGEDLFYKNISAQKPFGIRTYFVGEDECFKDSVKLYGNQKNKFISFISKEFVKKNTDLIDQYKVIISSAYGMGKTYPYQVLNKPFVSEPGSCCSETYIVLRVCDSYQECLNLISYVNTKFFRFLVLMKKHTQHGSRDVYSLVPDQDFSKTWTDEELYKKYGLTQDEINYIESMIRPMNFSDELEV